MNSFSAVIRRIAYVKSSEIIIVSMWYVYGT